MSNATLDPALVDRQTTLIAAVHESDLPIRKMSIAGFGASIDARILSKASTGATTRLVSIPDGWGTKVAGGFTADISLFVVHGSLTIGDSRIGQYSYAALRTGELISGVRCEERTVALLMTSAPVRYDTAASGGLHGIVVRSAEETGWEPQDDLPGRFRRPLWSQDSDEVWLAGAPDWANNDGPWMSHPTSEECFMLDGEMTITELIDDEPRDFHYRPGSYTWRPPRALHGGPGSRSGAVAISFNRTPGRLVTDLSPITHRDSSGSGHGAIG